MIKRIGTIAEALKLSGTMQEASVKPFTDFLSAKFSGNPVEACWNHETNEYKNGVLKKGWALTKLSYYCLRSFNNNHTNPTDAFMMKITNKSGRPEITKEFYDYLFSKDSPWSSAFPGLALVGEDKNGIPEAILWYDVGKSPSKVVANLLSAMRLHTCWGSDWFFNKLVSTGFSPEVAILLSSNFSWSGQTLTVGNGEKEKFDPDPRINLSLSKLGCSKTDMPFSTNYNPSGFLPLFKKKPVGNMGTLKDGTPVQPNNYIWHADEVATNSDTLNKNSSEYADSKIKIVTKQTPLHKYLSNDVKLSSDYIKEIEEKLTKNELLEV